MKSAMHTNFIVQVDSPVLEPSQKKTQVILGIDVWGAQTDVHHDAGKQIARRLP